MLKSIWDAQPYFKGKRIMWPLVLALEVWDGQMYLHLCADKIANLNSILWRFDGILLDFVEGLTSTTAFN